MSRKVSHVKRTSSTLRNVSRPAAPPPTPPAGGKKTPIKKRMVKKLVSKADKKPTQGSPKKGTRRPTTPVKRVVVVSRGNTPTQSPQSQQQPVAPPRRSSSPIGMARPSSLSDGVRRSMDSFTQQLEVAMGARLDTEVDEAAEECAVPFFEGQSLMRLEQPVPVALVPVMKQVTTVVGGDNFAVCLTTEGNVYSWGSNDAGQLGHGAAGPPIQVPQQISALPTGMVVHLAASAQWCLASSSMGRMWRWGNNHHEDVMFAPTAYPGRHMARKGAAPWQVVDVVLGASHACARTACGAVLTWGLNKKGSLGRPGLEEDAVSAHPPEKSIIDSRLGTPVRIKATAYTSCVLTDKGNLIVWGPNPQSPSLEVTKPTKINTDGVFSDVVHFAVSGDALLVVSRDGYVHATGSNACCQQGVPLSELKWNTSWSTIEFVDEEETSGSPSSSPSKPRTSTGSLGDRRKSKLFMRRRSSSGFRGRTHRASLGGDEQGTTICQVAIAGTTCAAVSQTGHLYVWGNNPFEIPDRLKPCLVSELKRVQISMICSLGDKGKFGIKVGVKSTKDLQFQSFNPPLVRAGTAEALLGWLVDPKCPHSFRYAFLLSHDACIPTLDLVSFLDSAFHKAVTAHGAQNPAAKAVVGVITEWLLLRPRGCTDFDIADVASAMRSLIQKVSKYYSAEASSMSDHLVRTIASKHRPRTGQKTQVQLDEMLAKITSYGARTMAEQATLVEHELLARIKPYELLKQCWSKQGAKGAPGVVNMIDHFNNMHAWVSTYIVHAPDKKERKMRANFFVDVLAECMELRNYATARAIQAAVNGVAIRKLVKSGFSSWSKKSESILEAVEAVFANNSKNYRVIMKDAIDTRVAAVPYLGCHLTDITFMDDGMQKKTADGLVNWTKYRLICSQIEMIECLGSLEYSTKPTPLCDALRTVRGYSEDALYRHAKGLADGSVADSSSSLPLALKQTSTASVAAMDSVSEIRRLNAQTQRMNSSEVLRYWKQWDELLTAEADTERMREPDGSFVSYRTVFNRSKALENSVSSALKEWPDDKTCMVYLKRILQRIVAPGHEDRVQKLPFLLQDLGRCQLSRDQIRLVANMVGSFKLMPSHDVEQTAQLAASLQELTSLSQEAVVDFNSTTFLRWAGRFGLCIKRTAQEEGSSWTAEARSLLQEYIESVSDESVTSLLSTVCDETQMGDFSARLQALEDESARLVARLKEIEVEKLQLRRDFIGNQSTSQDLVSQVDEAKAAISKRNRRLEVLTQGAMDRKAELRAAMQSLDHLDEAREAICIAVRNLYKSLTVIAEQSILPVKVLQAFNRAKTPTDKLVAVVSHGYGLSVMRFADAKNTSELRLWVELYQRMYAEDRDDGELLEWLRGVYAEYLDSSGSKCIKLSSSLISDVYSMITSSVVALPILNNFADTLLSACESVISDYASWSGGANGRIRSQLAALPKVIKEFPLPDDGGAGSEALQFKRGLAKMLS